jgi:hypothetical protein
LSYLTISLEVAKIFENLLVEKNIDVVIGRRLKKDGMG